MAHDEVAALLQQYEQLARTHGSIAINYLQPGLTEAEITEVEQRYGFPLSQDVKAIWSWHNGIGPRPSPEAPTSIGAGWNFSDLDASINYAQMVLGIRNEGDADRYVFSRWVTFDQSTYSDVIETSNTELRDSYVLISDMTASVLNYPILTVAEKLRWFIWAIEEGAWYVDDRGAWKANFELYPKDAMRNVL